MLSEILLNAIFVLLEDIYAHVRSNGRRTLPCMSYEFYQQLRIRNVITRKLILAATHHL